MMSKVTSAPWPALSPFVRVRPVREEDLDGLLMLASAADGGLTNLPKDRDFLQHKISASLRAFDPRVDSAEGERYLFVLEDVRRESIVGTSSIVARIGGFRPFYSYQIVPERIQHAPLGISEEMRVLHVKRSYTGPSEVCGLVLDQAYCASGLGRLLSLCRFVFMACFPNRFEKTVIAALRGVLDESERSPFWEGVMRLFFKQEFQAADFWSGLGHKQFIEDLMPRYPLYVRLLPKEVQETIGKVHQRSQGAYHILMNEGFSLTDQVDIFDAGPMIEAVVANVRTVRACQWASVAIEDSLEQEEASATHIIAKPTLDFRACTGAIRKVSNTTVIISSAAASNLGVKEGEQIVHVPLK